MALVKTPVAGFTGLIGADQFVNGQCEVANNKLAYYQRHGYTSVQGAGNEKPEPVSEPNVIGISLDESAPKQKWEALAQKLGIDPAKKTKTELIEAVKAAAQEPQ